MKLQKLKSLLGNMEGDWISQRTIYCLKTKKMKIDQMKVQINLIKRTNIILAESQNGFLSYFYEYYPLSSRKIIYDYIITNQSQWPVKTIKGIIQKDSGNILEKYTFVFHSNYLKIHLNKQKIDYTEYIYFINSKFRISTILMKTNKNYTSISFHSDIKIGAKNQ